MKISHSSITTYLDCQKKWDLIYNQGIKLSNIHFEFGKMAHKVLETRCIPDEILYPNLKEAFGISSWNIYFTDVMNDIERQMNALGYTQIEKEMKVENEDIVGIIDAVWKNRTTGRILITDYKFSNGYKGYNELMCDEQMYIYAYLYCLKTGAKLNEISLGYINIPKVQINEPRVLSSGKLSKDKSQYTTYEKYINKIKELGLEESDYEDILDILKSKEYVSITITNIDEKRFGIIIDNVYNVMKDMSKGYILEKHSYLCTQCEYYDYCKYDKHKQVASFNGKTLDFDSSDDCSTQSATASN